MKTYIARGHAFVPVEVKIEVQATSRTLAILEPNKALSDKRPYVHGEPRLSLKDYIVGNSEDEGAAFGFDAIDAEEK
jgi:hypothetical protein